MDGGVDGFDSMLANPLQTGVVEFLDAAREGNLDKVRTGA